MAHHTLQDLMEAIRVGWRNRQLHLVQSQAITPAQVTNNHNLLYSFKITIKVSVLINSSMLLTTLFRCQVHPNG